MKPYAALAVINSLSQREHYYPIDTVTVLKETKDANGRQQYIVDYKGVKCTAIFNWFTGYYYADDIYGRIN